MDKFLSKKYCDRCGKSLKVRKMSRFNTDCLCEECISKEKQHKDYRLAADAELGAYKNGVQNYPGIGLPDDLKPEQKCYTLYIRRYNRHLNFDTLGALRNELSRYFSHGEIENGIVERLTTFDKKEYGQTYYKNNYQDIDVCYYLTSL